MKYTKVQNKQTEELKNQIESFQRPGYSEISEQPKLSRNTVAAVIMLCRQPVYLLSALQ